MAETHLLHARGLTEAHLTEIEALAAACDRADGIVMRLNWMTLRSRPDDQVNDFLYHEDGRLVGYFALYQFQPDQTEVTAMTHPERRRRGIFWRLLAAATEELQSRKVPSMLFFAERHSPAAAPTMRAIGAVYESSEYLMQAMPDRVSLAPGTTGLSLRPATRAEAPELARLDAEAFGMSTETNLWLLQALDDPTQEVWVATLDGQTIGKIHGRTGEDESHIFAFSLKPEWRGRGYGRAVLSMAMERLLAKRRQKISLEVATENERALTLYQSRGFEVVTAYDYYRYAIPS